MLYFRLFILFLSLANCQKREDTAEKTFIESCLNDKSNWVSDTVFIYQKQIVAHPETANFSIKSFIDNKEIFFNSDIKEHIIPEITLSGKTILYVTPSNMNILKNKKNKHFIISHPIISTTGDYALVEIGNIGREGHDAHYTSTFAINRGNAIDLCLYKKNNKEWKRLELIERLLLD